MVLFTVGVLTGALVMGLVMLVDEWEFRAARWRGRRTARRRRRAAMIGHASHAGRRGSR